MLIITAKFEQRCHACGKVHIQEMQLSRGGQVPNPELPKGWGEQVPNSGLPKGWIEVDFKYGKFLYCGDHELVVMCDGKVSLR